MAITCPTLTKSRGKNCKSSVAGIRAIGFGVYDPMNRVVTTSAGVVALSAKYGAGTIARFDVKNTTSKYIQNMTKGADSNGKNIKGTATLTLAVMPDATERLAMAEIVDTFMDRDWVLFIEYKDGTILCAGSQNGAEVLLADNDSGATGNDLNGYMITITTDEQENADKYTLSGAGLTEYALAIMAV